MTDTTNAAVPVIDDANFEMYTENAPWGGRCGTVAPKHGYKSVVPFSVPLIPREQWPQLIAEQARTQSRLSDLVAAGDRGQPIPHLDQNGQGFCWAYSTAHAIIACSARDGQPYRRLSAHAVACKIKNFRDQGGWNPLSAEFAINRGFPTVETWPEQSMSRSYDTAETWEEAKRYRITEGYMDLTPRAWDRNLTFDQLATCLLCRIPCPVDFMWWGHSVCALDLLEVDGSRPLHDIARWGVGIWNSWKNWGRNGYGIIKGRKAVPDGACAVGVVTQS